MMFENMEMWFWVYAALAILFTLIGVLMILIGDNIEKEDGIELLIKFWGGSLMVVITGVVLTFIIKPLIVLLAQSVWYIF